MKKILFVVVALLLVFTCFTGCSKKKNEKLKFGHLFEDEAEINKFNRYVKEQAKISGVPEEVSSASIDFINSIPVYNSVNELGLAMNSGKIDMVTSMPLSTGKYLKAKDDDISIFVGKPFFSNQLTFLMAMQPKDSALRDKINAVLEEMKVDGSLDALKTECIDNVIATGKEPVINKIPSKDGAETIKVAITGDFPPLDYVSADGKPAGYNTALMSKIGEKLNLNIEFVSVTADARIMALASGKVDIVFWFRNIGSPMDTDELVFTVPYFIDDVAFLSKKFSEQEMGELLKRK